MKKAFVLLAFYVAPWGSASSGQIETTINRIGLVSETFAIIKFTHPMPTLPACAVSDDPNSEYVVSFDKSTPHGQDMLALVESAFENYWRVKIQYSDATCGWAGVRPLMTRIDAIK